MSAAQPGYVRLCGWVGVSVCVPGRGTALSTGGRTACFDHLVELT